MILNDFTEPRLKFGRDKLDAVLAELCGLVISGQQDNPDFFGMVAAAVIDPRGQLVTGVNYLYGNGRVHAERAAIDKYEEEYGELPRGSIVVTTLSPCSQDTHDNRHGDSCTQLLNSKHIKLAYCGYKDPTQEKGDNNFIVLVTDNSKIEELCKQFADTFLEDDLCEVTKLCKSNYNIKKIEEQFGPIVYKNDNQHFGLMRLANENKKLYNHCMSMSIGYDRGFNIFCDIIESKEYADCGKSPLNEDIDPTDQNLIEIFDRFNSFNADNFSVGDTAYLIELSAVEGVATNNKNIYIEHTNKPLEIANIQPNYITFTNGDRYPDKFIQQTKRWSQLVMFANEVKMNSCLATLLMYQSKLGNWTLNTPEKLSENFADGKVKGKSRPGRVKKAGASCSGSVTDLRSKAKKYGGEKGKMYQWCLNMKSGKKKTNEDKSFNQCYATACKLYDNAEAKGLEPKLVQVAGYKGDGSQADPKWLKMPQEYWQHYVTIVDDTVLDPTADQFGPGKATKYLVAQLNSEWNKQYQIRPKELSESKGLSPTLVQDIITAVPETEEIWFHGSRATGKHKRTSDTDILVIVPSTIAGDAYFNTVRKLQQLSAQYNNYDIQPSHPTNNIALIAREEGKCLFKKTNEVIHHTGIKTKNQDSSGLVNKGQPVPPGKEAKLLGSKVGNLGAYEVYKWDKGNDSAYSVYDPKTRVSQLTVSGHNRAHSFEIFGVYGGPQSPVRAADLYAWLVKKLGLTLVSDKYQSPGGQRVWQELEQRYGRSINVYAFNMKTNQPINTGADDPESTHGTRGDVAQNVRLVAAPK